MNIKSQKDFFSGLMFMGVGVAFAWGATGYTLGDGARMGPGYFPLALGVLLALPVAAIAMVLLRYGHEKYTRSGLYGAEIVVDVEAQSAADAAAADPGSMVVMEDAALTPDVTTDASRPPA